MQRKAAQDLVTDAKTEDDREKQELGTLTSGYKAPDDGSLLGSFEEKY